MNDDQIVAAIVQGDVTPLAEFIYRTIPPAARDEYLPHLAAILNAKAPVYKKASAMKALTDYLALQKVVSPAFSFNVESIVTESWNYVTRKKKPDQSPAQASNDFLNVVQQAKASIDSVLPEKDTVKLYEAVKKGTAHPYHMLLKHLESPDPDEGTMEIFGVKLPNLAISDMKFDKLTKSFNAGSDQ